MAEQNDVVTAGAHQHHLMLHLGLTRSADVVAWADRMLWSFDDPPAALIDVSLASPESLELDMAQMLEPLMTSARDVTPLRPVLGAVAARLRTGELELSDVIRRLSTYGVADTTGSRWLPPDMYAWLWNLMYESVNLHYVYPSEALCNAGVRDMFDDLVTGLQRLSEHGKHDYRIREAVMRAKQANDAELKPVPHNREPR